jgi:hypothetical protein
MEIDGGMPLVLLLSLFSVLTTVVSSYTFRKVIVVVVVLVGVDVVVEKS